MTSIHAHISGYPRIGEQRELKKATEAFWSGQIELHQLEETGQKLRLTNWRKQREAGIDLVPCNDFSFYDQVLDMSCLLGNVPSRFSWKGGPVPLDILFQMARGGKAQGNECCGGDTFACEMTKWFDTNYHYIVPEFRSDTVFALSGTKVFDEFAEARAAGFRAKPVLIGPVTYLALGKAQEPGFDPFTLLDNLTGVYEKILGRLSAQGAEWVQFDEPVLALDLSPDKRAALHDVYRRLKKAAGPCRVLVASCFGPLRENLPDFLNLPVDALHFDAVRGAGELDGFLAQFPKNRILSLGVVD
ncbi:MAG TPA: 5-methyltetrahydropteroyltriglutamate--homocysteine S-methyltransferase, partial [Verrucomicrobiales bacterium]|nr:5-methyltetrahydropteroyltriglutamate--homocysteine S-methyltransferase [Verrucomicrobiales bacterium]